MLVARWVRPHSAPVSWAGRKLHLCSRQLARPSLRVLGDVTDDMFPFPAYLPKSKPVTRFPSGIPAIHLSPPPTHTHTHAAHARSHQENIRGMFSPWTQGRWMSLSCFFFVPFCIWMLCETKDGLSPGLRKKSAKATNDCFHHPLLSSLVF